MSICIEHVSKRIRGVDVLNDVTLSVPDGSVVGLAGANGSGKTMLMRVVAGLVRPTSGFVSIDGARLWRDIPFPPSIGLLIENPAFLDFRTGMGNLELIASVKDVVGRRPGSEPRSRRERKEDRRRELARIVELVGLDPDDRRLYRAYSLGMKQRLGIASAIMERPDVLLLDEPTNALDSSGVAMLKEVVRRERDRGACVMLACHDAATLRELSDEVYVLAEGRLDGHEVAGGCDGRR